MKPIIAVCLILGLAGCEAYLSPQQMADDIKICRDLGLGFEVMRNGFTMGIVSVQCSPTSGAYK